MGRPRLPESEKLRSFHVRLAPKTTGRLLLLIARIDGRPGQELLRDIIVPALEELYAATIAKGHDLPSQAKIATMSDQQFNLLIGKAKQKPVARARLKRTPAHADA
jgi:hypothetical protein